MSEYKYGFHDSDVSVFRSKSGLNEEIVRLISARKQEPSWMLDFRLKAFRQFEKMPMPESVTSRWFSLSLPKILAELNFDEMTYYVQPSERQGKSWDEVPTEIKETFDKLGIPE